MNFYKITNSEECHHCLKYHHGLNIDTEKFNPSGTCKSGGIYFAREDILAFINYGMFIRKVTLPPDAQVYKDPQPDPEKWKADKVILGPKRIITSVVIDELLKEGADPYAYNSKFLIFCIENGLTNWVKTLIDNKVNFSVRKSQRKLLETAILCNNLAIAKLLINAGYKTNKEFYKRIFNDYFFCPSEKMKTFLRKQTK
jgi:hypothetical protein